MWRQAEAALATAVSDRLVLLELARGAAGRPMARLAAAAAAEGPADADVLLRVAAPAACRYSNRRSSGGSARDAWHL